MTNESENEDLSLKSTMWWTGGAVAVAIIAGLIAAL